MNPGDAKHLAAGAQGVGASVLRKEDGRFMTGRGQFVGDLQLAGMWTWRLRARRLRTDAFSASQNPPGANP